MRYLYAILWLMGQSRRTPSPGHPDAPTRTDKAVVLGALGVVAILVRLVGPSPDPVRPPGSPSHDPGG